MKIYEQNHKNVENQYKNAEETKSESVMYSPFGLLVITQSLNLVDWKTFG